ncbi:MAG: hypothetical protein JO011_00375, partial [Ktedonobacteraceae bacterium]|nr:hypothetical protein [Ktedonobacteraceae bacterium]
MDPIVTTALVGTAHQGHVNLATATPVDALIDELPAGEIERKLLLSAGAWAVYRQAGRKAQQIAVVPEPSAPETLRPCSRKAALLLSRLLKGEHTDLLPEALERLRKAGMHLPFNLLPQALNGLNHQSKELHAIIFPVLGERGRWLSTFNPAWNWVRDFLPGDENSLSADAETIWQEGTTAQRVEILYRLRAVDQEKARSWLEAAWKQEKAEVRCELAATLEIGLSASDEAFLENALDDRAASVRAVAASLLARIPTSAFVGRMYTRGSAMLNRVKGKLSVEPPNEIEKDWLRDGIIENPPEKQGKRTMWLIQVLSTIPPTFWETHLGARPAELIALTTKDKQWGSAVIYGWSGAVSNYNTPDWVLPLWNWWCRNYDKVKDDDIRDYYMRAKLLKCMSPREAEQAILTLLAEEKREPDNHWLDLLSELPRPWSVEFGHACLQLLRTYCSMQRIKAKNFNPYSDPWFGHLPIVALSLPAACFAEAQQPW